MKKKLQIKPSKLPASKNWVYNEAIKFTLLAISIILMLNATSQYAQCLEQEAKIQKTIAEEATASVPATDTSTPLDKKISDKFFNNGGKAPSNSYAIFDDKTLLNGYSKMYRTLPKEILLEMIKDDTLNSYKAAAAVRVFNENFSTELVLPEKKKVIKILLRRLARTDSPFVQIETMYTLCCLQRYKYFKSMVPALIQKIGHYNSAVNEIAFENLDKLIKSGNNRAREARTVFNTLRKILFLSRKRLANISKPDPKLNKNLTLLRWSIKVLGSQELKKLPKEVIHLL